jgi:hypothetical protein
MRGHQCWTIRRVIGVLSVCLIADVGSPAAAGSVARGEQPVPCENLASLTLPDAKTFR